MKTLTDIQELAAIGGGQITTDTSGQYDIGYLLGCAIANLKDMATYFYRFYPHYY